MSELITAEELATRLRVRPSTVRTWGRAGRIPTVRISPKVVRYDAEAVMHALAAETKTGGVCQKVCKGVGHVAGHDG